MKRTLKSFGALSPAEQKLRDEVGLGRMVVIGDSVPDKTSTARNVRAGFVRYLLMGGCGALPNPIREDAIKIKGARITEILNLEGCRIPREIGLVDCRFDSAPKLKSAQIDTLWLDRSVFPGLTAERLIASGDVCLRRCEIEGVVRLVGANVGGTFYLSNATINVPDRGNALIANRITVKGNFSLIGAGIWGNVRLLGAAIGGDLDATQATLAASDQGHALNVQGARITGALSLRFKTAPTGFVVLTAVHAKRLLDLSKVWPAPGKLILDRLTYDAFTGDAPQSADDRIDWLELQMPKHLAEDFRPQPWEHCAKVLREAGHGDAGRQILVRKDFLQRKARRQAEWRTGRYVRWFGRLSTDGFLWATTDYGRRPLKAAVFLLFLWFVGAAIFDAAAEARAVKPNNAFILRAPEWAACHPDYQRPTPGDPALRWRSRHGSQLDCFRTQPEAKSYPRFNPWIYSADTLLPIVDLEMQGFWIPDGGFARMYLWIHIALGWLLSLLAVAGFSGLIKTDNT